MHGANLWLGRELAAATGAQCFCCSAETMHVLPPACAAAATSRLDLAVTPSKRASHAPGTTCACGLHLPPRPAVHRQTGCPPSTPSPPPSHLVDASLEAVVDGHVNEHEGAAKRDGRHGTVAGEGVAALATCQDHRAHRPRQLIAINDRRWAAEGLGLRAQDFRMVWGAEALRHRPATLIWSRPPHQLPPVDIGIVQGAVRRLHHLHRHG